jgi:hypothetical protein
MTRNCSTRFAADESPASMPFYRHGGTPWSPSSCVRRTGDLEATADLVQERRSRTSDPETFFAAPRRTLLRAAWRGDAQPCRQTWFVAKPATKPGLPPGVGESHADEGIVSDTIDDRCVRARERRSGSGDLPSYESTISGQPPARCEPRRPVGRQRQRATICPCSRPVGPPRVDARNPTVYICRRCGRSARRRVRTSLRRNAILCAERARLEQERDEPDGVATSSSRHPTPLLSVPVAARR